MIRIAVVGGGAAGMMAAIAAGQAGAEVTLLEGNEKLGKKIYITGKGRCNVTNAAQGADFLRSVVHNPRFLYSSFAAFSNEALMRLMEGAGVPLKVERGGRVFPVSDKASDITKALEKLMRKFGVRIVLRAKVEGIESIEGGFDLKAGGRKMRFDRVILACGGASYPSTGSDGSGYGLARGLGHTVTDLKPSLIPVVTKDDWCRELQGLSLKNVRLTAKMGKKTLFDELGEMLFTHFGISGPLVLSMSCAIVDADLDKLEIFIDMKPGLTREQLENRLLRDFEAHSRGRIAAVLDGLLPRSMTPVIARLAGVAEDAPVSQISRAQREALVGALKAVPVRAAGFRPLGEAIVTRGGVSVKEIDPKTMESKLVPGLYFAGEMVDVDALTGGYNLQAAFSMGHCAGESAARTVREEG
jgi:predicted Rossmann fold flavoprotein